MFSVWSALLLLRLWRAFSLKGRAEGQQVPLSWKDYRDFARMQMKDDSVLLWPADEETTSNHAMNFKELQVH